MDSMMRAIGVGRQHKEETLETPDLCRSTSRLVSPVVGSPPGILLNPARPVPSTVDSTAIYTSTSATSSRSSIASPVTPPLEGTSPLDRPTVITTIHRLPSTASSLADSTSSSRGRSPTVASSSNNPNKLPLPSPNPANRKIRFAPLPEIRQRSYSTGRNVGWDVITEGEGGLDDQNRGLVRRDAADPVLTDSSDVDVDEEPEASTSGIFGSYGSLSGSSPFRTRSNQEDSVTNKLLRVSSFGLAGKKKKKGGNTSTEDLSRTLSRESESSRTSSAPSQRRDESLPRQAKTGIPVRQTQSWDSSTNVAPSSRRARKRAQYPPVAQRSRNPAARPTKPIEVNEDFVEWSGRNSLGSRATSNDDDDEDGSGLAWVRKRRAQREAEEKAKREREEKEGAVARDATLEQPVTDESPLQIAKVPVPAVERKDSGTSTPTAIRSPALPSSRSMLSATRPTDIETSLDGGNRQPERSDSQTLTPTASRSNLGSAAQSQQANNGILSSSPTSLRSGSASDSEDDEEDDDDDDDRVPASGSDTESDLDEDELAEEEMLTEKARKTAVCAGAEKFVDANHLNKLLTVNKTAN